MARKTVKYDYLIVGNSAGGIGCVEGVRKADRKGSIAVVSDENYHTYSRPLITHLLKGDVTEEGMDFRPRDFYYRYAVEPLLGYRAEKIDAGKKSLKLVPTGGGAGRTVAYGKLLISTGGRPFIPPMDGSDMDGVTAMMTLDQSLAVKGRLEGVKNAVVLGAGLIGTKTAQALAPMVGKVTMVEMADRILSPVTDQRSSAMAADAFRSHGVEIMLNNTVTEVRGRAVKGKGRKVSSVLLRDGTVLPCDLLILAIGVRPRTELAESGGLAIASMKVGGGVEVGVGMQTSAEDVYACGDCAHAHDFVTGAMRLLPLWPNAYIGGRIAGLNMAGGSYSHRWATNMNSVDFFGFPMVSAGYMLKPAARGFEEMVVEEGGNYGKLILEKGVIKGMIMAGRVDRAGIYLGLMRSRVNVSSFRDALLTDDFSVVRLPGEVKDLIKQPIREIE